MSQGPAVPSPCGSAGHTLTVGELNNRPARAGAVGETILKPSYRERNIQTHSLGPFLQTKEESRKVNLGLQNSCAFVSPVLPQKLLPS